MAPGQEVGDTTGLVYCIWWSIASNSCCRLLFLVSTPDTCNSFAISCITSFHPSNIFCSPYLYYRYQSSCQSLKMFPLRHAAARLFTSRSVTFVSRPRTITSFASISARPSRIVVPLQFQRRWASGEAEAKKDGEELPISQMQPTPQEEVENAIHEDNAAAEGAQASEAPQRQISSDHSEQAAVNNAVQSQSPVSRLTNNVGGEEQRSSYVRTPRAPATPKESIYVGNLFFDVTENDLEKEFSRFGNIKAVRLIKDIRGLSKGFGYIEYDTTESATAAIEGLNQQTFEGRRLLVSFAHTNASEARERTKTSNQRGPPRPENPPSKTLFIGNMSFEMTDRDLNNLFRGIRNVIDVRVAIDRRTGQPRGFAHADFTDTKSAMDAMAVLQGKEHYGRSLRVDFSFGPSTAPRNTPR